MKLFHARADHDDSSRRIRRWGRQPRPDAPNQAEPSTGEFDDQASAIGGRSPGRTARWTAGSALAVAAVRALLWAWLLAIPIAALVVAMNSPSTIVPAAGPSGTATAATEQAAVGEFAGQFVLAWAQTDQEHSGSVDDFVETPDSVTWPNKPLGEATGPQVAATVQSEKGIWSVTIGADIKDSHGDVQHRYFLVPVAYASGDMVALSLPTPVAAPQRAPAPDTAYADDVPVDSAAGKTIVDFLTTSLTGDGDLTRYLSPGAQVRPVSPADYNKVQVTEIAADTDLGLETAKPSDGEEAHVLTTATAETPDGRSAPVQYSLTLRARDGRWEVAALDPAPLLDLDTTH